METMKKIAAFIIVLGIFALPGIAAAGCWECVADYCDEIPWVGSINGHYGRYHCNQTVRCLPSGACYNNCFAFGDVCSYWDVWF